MSIFDMFLWVGSWILLLTAFFAISFMLICILSYILLSPCLHILFAKLRKRLFLKKMVKYGKHPVLYPLFSCIPVAILCCFVIAIINYSGVHFVVEGVHDTEEGERLFITNRSLVIAFVSAVWFWMEYLVLHRTTIQMFQDLRLNHITLYRDDKSRQLVIFVHYDLYLQAKSGETWDCIHAPIDPTNRILIKKFPSASAMCRYVERFDLQVLELPSQEVA